jgi:threonine dehydrogenase-like Zn-dependent dehydrogenase
MALNAAPRGSEVILMGLSSSPASFQPLRFVREGLRMSGSLIYDHPHDFMKAISLVEEKTLSPKSIVSDTFSFDRIQEAMQVASTGKAGKIILDMRV